METNGAPWITGKAPIPQAFVKGLLGHLSSADKTNLIEVAPNWAKAIIGVDPSLRVVHVTSNHAWKWVRQQLQVWLKVADSLLPKSRSLKEQLSDVKDVVGLLSNGFGVPKGGAWIVVDKQNRLQAIAEADVSDDQPVWELNLLATAPWNLFRKSVDAVRGAGTLLIAAITRHANMPLVFEPLGLSLPFYRRLGSETLNSTESRRYFATHRLSRESTKARLGHLPLSQLPDSSKLSLWGQL